jgi:hypothetical protein
MAPAPARRAEPLRLTKAEFDTYFPYVSNVWSYQKKYIRKDGVEIQHWNCRMQPQTNKSTKDTGNILKDKDEKAKKARSKKIRDGGTCKSFLRIEILLDSYTLSLTGDPHKHDLDYMDQMGRRRSRGVICIYCAVHRQKISGDRRYYIKAELHFKF